MREFFREIAPDHDEEKVYASDMKKIISWYQVLKDLPLFNEDEPGVAVAEETHIAVEPAKPVKAPIAEKAAKPVKAHAKIVKRAPKKTAQSRAKHRKASRRIRHSP